MPVLLSMITTGRRVLVEHFDGTFANCAPGNLEAIAKKVLAKTDAAAHQPRLSCAVDSYMVHYISMDGFVYLTTTNREMSKGVVFAFLENLQRRYHPTHCAMVREHLEGCRFQGMFPPGNQLPEQWKVAMEAKPVLEALMSSVNQTITHDKRGLEDHKTQQAHRAIDEVKHVMMENIEKVIDRGEKMDSLLDKSADLATSSGSFKRSSKRLADELWWNNMKYYAMLALAALIGLLMLAFLMCGFPTFASCRSAAPSNPDEISLDGPD